MTEVPPVSLPFEMPLLVDVSSLPIEVLKSNTVETLLAQTEDLSARLRVALRRMALLEQQLENSHLELRGLRRENQSLEDRQAIDDTKESSWRDKLENVESENQQLNLQLQNVRNLWAHEREENQLRIQALEAEIHELQREQRRLMKYRLKVGEIARRLRNHAVESTQQNQQLKLQLAESRERMQLLVDRLQGQGADYNQHIQSLTKTYEEKMTEVIFDAHQATEKMKTTHEVEIQDLCKTLDTTRQELHQKIEQLTVDNHQLKEKCSSLHAHYIHQVEIENRIQNLQKELSDAMAWREAAENKSRENSQLLRQNQHNERELQRLNTDNQALKKQVENLQSLWDQNRTTIEDLATREENMQRLNQNLAQQLNNLRKGQTLPIQQEFISSIDEQLTQILHSRHTLGGQTHPETTS